MNRISTFQIPASLDAIRSAGASSELPAVLAEPLQALVATITRRATESPIAIYLASDDGAAPARSAFAFALARALMAHVPSTLVIDCDFLSPGLHGGVPQKDALGFLAPFRGLVRAIYTVPIPGAHEAPHAQEDLAEVARGAGMQAIDRENVIDALQTIAALPKGPKRVLICGSLYLAGHVLSIQQQLQ